MPFTDTLFYSRYLAKKTQKKLKMIKNLLTLKKIMKQIKKNTMIEFQHILLKEKLVKKCSLKDGNSIYSTLKVKSKNNFGLL